MTVILKHDHPMLLAECAQADPLSDRHMAVVSTMRRALELSRIGAGLAAPQIGSQLRIIAIRPISRGPITFMVNPQITAHSQTKVEHKEGCLSYPGVNARVERWKWVTLDYCRPHDAARVREDFHGFEARIVQHEVDHLDGICKVGDVWRWGRKTERPRYKRRKARR